VTNMAGFMLDLHYIFKNFIKVSGIALLICGCEDIPRDNILDPKNPASSKDHTVVIEAFVNTNDSLPLYNFWMLDALNALHEKYGDDMVICEYHRNIKEYNDPYVTDDNDLLYAKYTDVKGVPDVYMNGSGVRVQGSSGSENSLIRLETALQDLWHKKSYFTFEPEIRRDGNTIQLRVVMARLGSKSVQNITVKAIIKEKIDDKYHRNVVRKVMQSPEIDHMGPGDIQTVSFDAFDLGGSGRFSLVLLASSAEKIEHYQAQEVLIP
jgi:hypothetical protein